MHEKVITQKHLFQILHLEQEDDIGVDIGYRHHFGAAARPRRDGVLLKLDTVDLSKEAEAGRPPSFCLQLRYCFTRAILQQPIRSFAWQIILMLILGFLFGSIHKWRMSTANTISMRLTAVALTTMEAIMVPGVLFSVSGVRLFSFEKVIFRREMNTNISVTAYFLGKVMFQILFDVLWQPMAYVMIYYFQTTPLSPSLWSDYFIFLLVSWWCTGLGMLLGLTFDYTVAMLNAVVIPLILGTTLAGVMPTRAEMTKMGLSLITVVTDAFSMSRYMVESRVLLEYSSLPRHIQLQVGEDFLENLSYKCCDNPPCENFCSGSMATNAWIIFLFGLFFRILTWMFLLKEEAGGWYEAFVYNLCLQEEGGIEHLDVDRQVSVGSQFVNGITADSEAIAEQDLTAVQMSALNELAAGDRDNIQVAAL